MPLVPVPGLSFLPKYFHQGLPSATVTCWVAEPVVARLLHAQRILRSRGSLRVRYNLMIWDAYRAPATQHRIFHDYARQLMQSQGLSAGQAKAAAARFVSRPDTVYPHGTGGAVDLTLLINDEEAFMGTGFDAFEECSTSDWYERNPPRSALDRKAAVNRDLLRSSMLHAGFVPYPDEWWHYEWGTARWSAATGHAVILDRTLSAPAATDPAATDPAPAALTAAP